MGIEIAYRKALQDMLEQMHASVTYWLRAAYRQNEPEALAHDELPATALRRAIRQLMRRWQSRFDEAAPALAAYFSQAASKRTQLALQKILRDGGFSVRTVHSRAVQDVLQATTQANVELIKSIPQQYLGSVQGAVMRSVQTGRDLSTLTDELQRAYGVTRRRAAFIAKDQNNKASASINRARQLDLGITQAVWLHSGGGKVPRPTHVKAGRDKVRFDVAKGWYDPALKKYIFPGTEPNCRCVSRAVVPGFS